MIVSSELERSSAMLAEALDLGEPFRDPGVGAFGLENAVFALGDCFLEVISPARPETAAGRYLQARGGDGGYMVIFDLEELEGARERAAALGVRVVWQIDLPDISGDSPAPARHGRRDRLARPLDPLRQLALGRSALDRADPRWSARAPAGRDDRGRRARSVAARWGEVLGVAPTARRNRCSCSRTTGCASRRVRAGEEGLVEITVELATELDASPRALDIGSVGVRRR